MFGVGLQEQILQMQGQGSYTEARGEGNRVNL